MWKIATAAALAVAGIAPASEPASWLGGDAFRAGTDVYSLEYSPDGKLIATGGAYQTVCLWDAETGRLVRRLNAGRTSRICYTVSFSADGSKLFSSEPFSIWDVRTGRRVFDLNEAPLYAAHSPEGGMIAYASGPGRQAVTVIDDAGQAVVHLQPPATAGPVRWLAFSPDGKRLAVGGYRGGYLGVWDIPEGTELFTCGGNTQSIDRVAFSPDGTVIAAGSQDHKLSTWDAKTGEPMRTLLDASEWNWNHRFCFQRTEDGPLLATDDDDGHIHLFDPRTGKLVRRWAVHPLGTRVLAFSPDGKTLAGAQARDTAVRLWDVETGKVEPVGTVGHAAPVTQLAPSADGRTLISLDAGGTAVEWDLAQGRELRKAHLPGVGLAGYVLSGDGRLAAYPLSEDLATVRYRPTFGDGEPKELNVGATNGANALCLDRAGTRLAVGGLAGIQTWPLPPKDGDPVAVRSPPGEMVSRVSLADDGARVAAALTGRNGYGIWDAETGRPELVRTQQQSVLDVRLSPDGGALAVLIAQQPDCIAVDPRTGREWRLDTPTPPAAAAFSPDGNLLAMIAAETGRDPAAWLVEFHSGRLVRRFTVPEHTDLSSVAFSRDGRTLFAGTNRGRIAAWDLTAGAAGGVALDALWEGLHDPDPAVAYPAIRALAARPAEAAALIRGELKPAAVPPDLPKLIDGLGSASYAVRQRSAASLVKLGDLAVPALRVVASGEGNPEAVRMAEQLLRLITVPPEQLWQRRALQVLEYADAEETRATLRELAAGADGAWLTAAAKAVLERLTRGRQ